MSQITVYMRENEITDFKRLVAEFAKKGLLPKNNQSTVAEKILKDYTEMMTKLKLKKGTEVFNCNLIFEYAKLFSATKHSVDELEQNKLAKFDRYMDRLLSQTDKTKQLETELSRLRNFADSVKYQSGESVLDLYNQEKAKGTLL